MVADLLRLVDPEEHRRWLEAHRPAVDQAFMEGLKDAIDQRKVADPHRALELVTIAYAAAAVSSYPLAEALIRWAEGNVRMNLGAYQACDAAYATAAAAFAAHGDDFAVARLHSNRIYPLTQLGRHAEAFALADAARHHLLAAGQDGTRYTAVLEANVGVAYQEAGRYAEALAAFDRCRAVFAQLDDAVSVARTDINRAIVLEMMDRFVEATTVLETARASLASHAITADVARADLNLAHLAFRRGRYGDALEVYERAQSRFAEIDDEMESAFFDFSRAQVYLALNHFTDAHTCAERAHHTFAAQGMARYAIQAMTWQAAATHGMGDAARALTLLGRVREALVEREEPVEVALVDLQHAALLHQAGEDRLALDAARAAAEVFAAHDMPVRLAQARLAMAEACLHLGQAEAAAPLCAAALDMALEKTLPTLAYRARFGLGRAAEARGDDDAAAPLYRAAIADLKAIHRDLRLDEFQATFLDDKLDVYEAAVRLALRQGDVEGAFDVVEASKAGALLDLLARGLELAGAEDDALAKRIQELREAWHWHTSQLEGYAPGEEPSPVRAGEPGTWQAVREIERALGAAWQQFRLRSQPRATWAGGDPLPLTEVQARLPRDTALVAYYAVADAMLAFVVRSGGIEAIDLGIAPAEVDILVGMWRFDLDSLRLMLTELAPDELDGLARESQARLEQLYQALVAPLADSLAGCTQVIVVPHRSIHHLPLAALHDGERYLGERFRISILPGASLLRQTVSLPERLPPLVLAHSDGGRLAHVLDEARQVGRILPGARVLVEEQVTEARLRAEAAGCGLLHLATHGGFRADNPLFSWLRLADGRLTVRDVYGLRLAHADLVTLSACETGLGDPRGGDVMGLSQGFLAAGARSLLLSLWAVDDASTTELMVTFYRQLAAGRSKSAALQQAQWELRQTHPHPFFWAGFVLVGED
ncbi:MAG: CHAT domain-containing protein [Anaerolineae bacterium]|nr:CHAT domain-containing protein [Anaerolineae bacterium]